MFVYDSRLLAPDPDPNAPPAGDPPAGDPPAGDPPAGDPPAKTLMGDPPAGDPPTGEWAWGDNLPGVGTAPPWFKSDKYKTVSDQAKAAPELEAKLGPAAEMLGAPEENYELPKLPDGVEGDWDPEDPMLSTFMVSAKEAGLSQAAFDKLVAPMATLLATERAAGEKAVTDALAELGANAEQRLNQVETYLTAEIGEEGFKALNNAIGTDVQAYTALEQLIAKTAGDAQLSSLPGKHGAGFTKEDIQTERYKVFAEGHNLAGQIMYDHDKDHRAKVDGMWKELFPGKDETQVD